MTNTALASQCEHLIVTRLPFPSFELVVPGFELVEGPEVVPTVEVEGDGGFWIWFWG